MGHRVVHAGEKYSGSVVIDRGCAGRPEGVCSLWRRLHNPANITGIEAAQKVMPDVPMVGVFDTAFHQTMPDRAYIYPIPYELYEDYGSGATASTAPATASSPCAPPRSGAGARPS